MKIIRHGSEEWEAWAEMTLDYDPFTEISEKGVIINGTTDEIQKLVH